MTFYESIIFILFLLGTLGTAHAEILDRIVAVVNNDVITLSELKQAETSILQTGPSSSKPAPAKLLNELINKKIKLQKAKELGIVVSDKTVDDGVNEIAQRNGLTETILKEKLKKEGIPWNDYREQIRDQIILTRMLNREIRSKIVLLPEEAKEYYLKHQDRFVRKAKKHILRILLTLPEGATQEIIDARKEEMEKLRKRIVSGENFRQLAIRTSEGPESKNGGDLGDFAEGELREDLSRAIAGLKAGDVSSVFRTPEGITLLMVEEIKKPKPIPFEKVQDSIRKALYQEKVKKKYESWIKELREEAYIEIKL
ncbi:MAG: hypothetical protein GXP58_11215 [Deltaproteobacteria bacterium]|nr:hypothetical protein [Deltaproteobacteria bacterium]